MKFGRVYFWVVIVLIYTQAIQCGVHGSDVTRLTDCGEVEDEATGRDGVVSANVHVEDWSTRVHWNLCADTVTSVITSNRPVLT